MKTVAMILALVAIAAPSAEAAPRYLLGDSLSSSFLPERGQTLPPWPEYLWGLDVVNLAYSGATTDDWALTIDEHAGPGQEWWLLIGTNDAAGNLVFGAPNNFDQNLPDIVAQLLDADVAEIHLMLSPGWAWYLVDESLQQTVTATIREQDLTVKPALCESDQRVRCGPDLFADLPIGPTYFLDDGVHPSDEGIERIAMLVPEPGRDVMLLCGIIGLLALRARINHICGVVAVALARRLGQ